MQGAYEAVEGGLPSMDDLEVAAAAAAAAMEALAVAPFGLRGASEASSPKFSDEARFCIHISCSVKAVVKGCRAPAQWLLVANKVGICKTQRKT